MDGLMECEYKNEHASCLCKLVEGLSVDAKRRTRQLLDVETYPAYRQQGYATKLIKRVCADADAEDICLVLVPEPYGTDEPQMSPEKLEAWYQGFGFKPIPETPKIYLRYPQKND